MKYRDNLAATGGYFFDGNYISFVVYRYFWGYGHELFVRDSYINGNWIGVSNGQTLDELIP